MLESLTKNVFLAKKLMRFKFELISAIFGPRNPMLKIRFLAFFERLPQVYVFIKFDETLGCFSLSNNKNIWHIVNLCC